MSADNGIYIIKTKRTALESPQGHWTNGKPNFVYRVAHAQAVDNLSWYEKNQPYNLGAYMKDVWGSSTVYDTEESAILAAHAMEKKIRYVEYGVQSIDMSKYVFYGDH